MAKGGGATRGNKRRFGGKASPHGPTPRRGPPAIFVTCEAGREKKCQREAFELIRHYYYAARPSAAHDEREGVREEEQSPAKDADSSDEEGGGQLSLEEELAMLRKGAAAEEVLNYEPSSKRQRTDSKGQASSKQISSMKSPFSVYDTGTRGMVCILCTLPDCEMVPYDDILAKIKAARDCGSKVDEVSGTKSDKEESGAGTAANEGNDSGDSDPQNAPVLWDPVEAVRCILRDAKCASETGNGSNDDRSGLGETNREEDNDGTSTKNSNEPPPGSRFITRLLPMQATCYASVEEIKDVSIALLRKYLPSCNHAILAKANKELSFKLEIKRRLSSHITRDQVIEAVTPVVLGGLEEMPGYKFSVNLTDPDFFVRIETCKGLAGISILPREKWYKNFNLAELTNPASDEKKK